MVLKRKKFFRRQPFQKVAYPVKVMLSYSCFFAEA